MKNYQIMRKRQFVDVVVKLITHQKINDQRDYKSNGNNTQTKSL